MRNLNSIVYVSTATRELSEEDLQSILGCSRNRNISEGITGVLFFSSGNFIQYLEGPDVPLSRVYSLICSDRRHQRITQLFNEPVKDRFFSGWSMGYAAAQVPDFDELLSAPWPSLTYAASMPPALPGIMLLHRVWLRLQQAGY